MARNQRIRAAREREKGADSVPLLEEVLSKISTEIAHYLEPISNTFRWPGSKQADKAD
jgi:hypothetical protein